MRWVLIIILFIVSCAQISAQFTYFNQITGEQGDLSTEVCSNIEVVDDGYVIWGGGINNDTLFHYIQKYDLFGNFLAENILYDGTDEYVYTGGTKSFQWNPYTETFVFINGVNLLGQNTVEGYLIEFDTNLDTVFTRRYNHYAPYTYPFIFKIEEDGYVVVGETGGIPYSAGTFIMKLDFAGNILWSEIMQPLVYEDIYRNLGIEKIEEGYLIAGIGMSSESNYLPFGVLTKTNNFGGVLSKLDVVDPTALLSSTLNSNQLQSGEILISQVISYADVEEILNPNFFWTKLKLRKYNPNNEEFYNEVDYFDNYDFFYGGPNDRVSTPDGGVLFLGGYIGWYYDMTAWMLKLDSNLEQEWYQEYSFQTCNDCMNVLKDVELTPDGGYVAAGTFVNLAVDPLQSTWLLKVDACGDVEWQGCSPVGIEEKDVRSFSVYPNPSAGRFMVETNGYAGISDWSVYNLAGQTVAVGSAPRDAQSLEIKLNLPSGLYALELVDADGKREYHKVQIVK